MKVALRFVPRGVQERARPAVDRAQAFIRDWEWTWTRAVVFSLVMWLLAVTFIAVIPSWWLYFADQTLGWRQTKFWLYKARDVVAIILFSAPTGAFMVIPYRVQKLRRRLRSESESRPTGGYR